MASAEQFRSAVSDCIQAGSAVLTLTLFRKQIHLCAPDQILYAIGLADVMYTVYLRDYSSYPVDEQESLPGVDDLILSMPTGDYPLHEYDDIRQVIFDGKKTYEEYLAAHNPELTSRGRDLIPALFTGIACDLVVSSARLHGVTPPDVQDDAFDNAVTNALIDLITALSTRLPGVPPLRISRMPSAASSRGAASIPPPQRQPIMTLKKFIILAIVGLGLGLLFGYLGK